MTANDLGVFLGRIREGGFLADDGLRNLQVKFGDSIDQDDKGTSSLEELEHAPGLFVSHDIEWDLELEDPVGIAEMIAALANDERRIYRASAMLGTAIDAILKPITRTNSPENERDFCPYSLSVDIRPIRIGSLACDEPVMFVGWIDISLSGPGYLFPWTPRHVVRRLEATDSTQRMMELCRSMWPLPPRELEDRIVEMRWEIGERWPYDELNKPWDWYWAVDESG
jgi:hypothetical protein